MSSVSGVNPVDELAAFLAQLPSAQALAAFRFSRAALERADELMDKNKAGTLTDEESRELDRFILLDDMIGLVKTHLPAADAPGA